MALEFAAYALQWVAKALVRTSAGWLSENSSLDVVRLLLVKQPPVVSKGAWNGCAKSSLISTTTPGIWTWFKGRSNAKR